MTQRSADPSSYCQDEISYARERRKRILTLVKDDEANRLPLDVQRVPRIPFTRGSEDLGWQELRQRLEKMATPEERIQDLEEEGRRLQDLLDCEIKKKAESKADQIRHEQAIRKFRVALAENEERIGEEQQHIRASSGVGGEASRQASEGIGTIQTPEPPEEGIIRTTLPCVNEPPPLPPNRFHDRRPETDRLADRLRDPSIGLVAVVGGAGIGKTAMLSNLLDTLRRGMRQLPVDAFIYLPTYGYRPIKPPALLEDLRKLVPDEPAAAQLAERLESSELTSLDKLDEVLDALGGSRIVVVIDNTEELLEPAGHLRDRELSEVVRALLRRRDHAVRLVFLTRQSPDALLREFGRRAARLDLDAGLPRTDAHELLRTLDAQDILGLRSATEGQLERARQVTGGHPRALELVYGVLESEPDTTLDQLLDEMPDDAEDVLPYLLVRLFDWLDPIDRRVLQMLAAYARPVPPDAVRYLLNWYLEDYDSGPHLRRLVERCLVRQDGDRVYVPPSPDGERLLARLPLSAPGDRQDPPPLTRIALFHRAAGYFRKMRRDKVECLDDLGGHFAEIDLRMRAQDYDEALELVNQIDGAYLRHWGYSEAVAHWREELVGKLEDPRVKVQNLSWLALARNQQDDQERAIGHLRDALDLAAERNDTEGQVHLLIDLGSSHFQYGEVGRAMKRYKQALAMARGHDYFSLREANARDGLALCLAETGEFRRGLRHHNKALKIVEHREDEEGQIIKARLCVNRGWIYLQMGRDRDARESLHRGRELARRLGEELLIGDSLNAEANVLIDIDHRNVDQALERARAAVAIAVKTRNVHLSREGNTTLALAFLCAGDVDAARAAAEAAARHRHSPRAFGPFLLKGIAAFRGGDRETARAAFSEAHVKAQTLREREGRNFQMLDALGLALSGLTVCGDHAQLDRAVSAYGAARAVTRAPGAVRRSRCLLHQLGPGAGVEQLTALGRAASGG